DVGTSRISQVAVAGAFVASRGALVETLKDGLQKARKLPDFAVRSRMHGLVNFSRSAGRNNFLAPSRAAQTDRMARTLSWALLSSAFARASTSSSNLPVRIEGAFCRQKTRSSRNASNAGPK